MSDNELLTVVTAILHSGGDSEVADCVARADHLIETVKNYKRQAPRVEHNDHRGIFDHLLYETDKTAK
jgi:hypothetical protein